MSPSTAPILSPITSKQLVRTRPHGARLTTGEVLKTVDMLQRDSCAVHVVASMAAARAAPRGDGGCAHPVAQPVAAARAAPRSDGGCAHPVAQPVAAARAAPRSDSGCAHPVAQPVAAARTAPRSDGGCALPVAQPVAAARTAPRSDGGCALPVAHPVAAARTAPQRRKPHVAASRATTANASRQYLLFGSTNRRHLTPADALKSVDDLPS